MDDDDGSPFNKISGTLPHGTAGYTFTGVTKGRNYTIELVATNNIGSTVLTTYFHGKYMIVLYNGNNFGRSVTTDVTTYSSRNNQVSVPSTTGIVDLLLFVVTASRIACTFCRQFFLLYPMCCYCMYSNLPLVIVK